MSFVYTTPDHLRPRELWRLHRDDGPIAYAILSPTMASVGVVWYLDGKLQDAAEFNDQRLAEQWADDVKAMLRGSGRA